MATTFPQQQIVQWIAFAPRDLCTTYEVCKPSNSKNKQVVSVAMVTECPWQQVKAWIAVASRDLCCKYEVNLPSNSKDISMCLCCHGNKITIATSNRVDSCCLKGSVYQIRTSYIFKQPSYKCMLLLPW